MDDEKDLFAEMLGMKRKPEERPRVQPVATPPPEPEVDELTVQRIVVEEMAADKAELESERDALAADKAALETQLSEARAENAELEEKLARMGRSLAVARRAAASARRKV